jgi:hypothetical protein
MPIINKNWTYRGWLLRSCLSASVRSQNGTLKVLDVVILVCHSNAPGSSLIVGLFCRCWPTITEDPSSIQIVSWMHGLELGV